MSKKLRNELVKLYQAMADLTKPKCATCRIPFSCCDAMYCEFAADLAKREGVELQRTNHPKLPFMGPTGCIVPPHLRPMCTMHECRINQFGFTLDDEWNKKYFKLRNRINAVEDKINRFGY